MICVVWIYWKCRLPKAPFMQLSLPHQVLGKPNLIWVIPLVPSRWRLKEAQLPKRTPSWPHIWDIKELKQLWKESAVNYVAQIAFGVGLALHRPWMRRVGWLWQAHLPKSFTAMGEWRTRVLLGRTPLFAGEESIASQDIWQSSHTLLDTTRSIFYSFEVGKVWPPIERDVRCVIFLCSTSWTRLLTFLLHHRVASSFNKYQALFCRLRAGSGNCYWEGWPHGRWEAT